MESTSKEVVKAVVVGNIKVVMPFIPGSTGNMFNLSQVTRLRVNFDKKTFDPSVEGQELCDDPDERFVVDSFYDFKAQGAGAVLALAFDVTNKQSIQDVRTYLSVLKIDNKINDLKEAPIIFVGSGKVSEAQEAEIKKLASDFGLKRFTIATASVEKGIDDFQQKTCELLGIPDSKAEERKRNQAALHKQKKEQEEKAKRERDESLQKLGIQARGQKEKQGVSATDREAARLPIVELYPAEISDYKLVKVVLLGASGVGKSQVLSAMMRRSFIAEYNETIGVDFGGRIVVCDGIPIKLQVWDTAGQGAGRNNITQSYYRGANVFCVMWGDAQGKSLAVVQSEVEFIKANYPDAAIVFVRCKSDLDAQLEMSVSDQLESIKTLTAGNPIIHTSAKTKAGIDDLLITIARVALPEVKARSAMVEVPAEAAEKFSLKKKFLEMKHSRKALTQELDICLAAEPIDETWLLMIMDSVDERYSQTSLRIEEYFATKHYQYKSSPNAKYTDMRMFQENICFNAIAERDRPRNGAVVELLKLLDDQERASGTKVWKFFGLRTEHVAEQERIRQVILDVAKNIYAWYKKQQDQSVNNNNNAVMKREDIYGKYTDAEIPDAVRRVVDDAFPLVGINAVKQVVAAQNN